MTPDHAHSERRPSDHRPSDHRHGYQAGDDGFLDLLDLDADVLEDYWRASLDWVRLVAGDLDRPRVFDLGAGSGTGGLGLTLRFRDATLVAVDTSGPSLRRLREHADALGLRDRVTTIELDLDTNWPAVGPFDVTWASMSLHHLSDPTQVLRRVRDATRTAGIIAVAEFVEPVRFLREDIGVGRPGFEDRVMARLRRDHHERLPTLGSAWTPRLADAGWRVIDERDFLIDLNPPEHLDAGRYAEAWMGRLGQRLEDGLDTDDRHVLQVLLDPHDPRSLRRRTDLRIHGVRTVTLARND